MTATEKAADLIEKYIEIMPHLKYQTGNSITEHAKKCAIVAVDEVLGVINNPCFSEYDYYKEVRSELEKIKTP